MSPRPSLRTPHGVRALGRLLALALVLGCGSGDDLNAPGGGNGNGDGDGDGRLPAQLVGRWLLEEAGDVYRDPATGQCTSSYARSESLTFDAGGRFEHALYAESSFPPCQLVAHHASEGEARVEGSTLELRITEGFTRIQDNCGESSETDESGATDRYTWTIAQGAGGTPELMLTNADGIDIGPFVLQP